MIQNIKILYMFVHLRLHILLDINMICIKNLHHKIIMKIHQIEPIFHQIYLPYLTILVNDIYWEYKFPRYITDTQIQELVESGNSRLQAVCDVTCDLEGSIQFLKKFTNPDHPVYYYNPITQSIHDEFDFQSQNDIMYMSIDFLPSQMPYEASMDFGKALRDIVPYLAYSDPNKPLEESGLPQFLQNATVTLHGQLTSKFEYINELRKINETENDHQKFKMITSYYSNKINANKDNTIADNKSFPQQQISELNAQEYQPDRNSHISYNRQTNVEETRKINNQQTFDVQIQIQ
ncbi:unnamed protein product [Paramecium sonneborni]|uniref:Uncharacterized protein n=1 Tax=Paramecium sonneborni TaxID=65129 RepID=A0A8S1RAG4_9CILI|nr:unnamed protein product [Paramecium sonneborni]